MRVRLLEPWRTRVLWASLGANLFAAALFVAPHVWHGHPGGPPSFDNIVQRMARDLAPADAETFRSEMSRERPWYELGRERLEQSREALAQTVATAPYDPVAARAALATMQDRIRESGARFNESLVMAVGKLSAEGRVRLADSLRKRRP